MSENKLSFGGSYVINPETHELVLQERTVNPGTEDGDKDAAVLASEPSVEKPKATTKSKADTSVGNEG